MLPCGHGCPLQCHSYDHAKVQCNVIVYKLCEQGHPVKTACSSTVSPSSCAICNELRSLQRKANLEAERLQKEELQKIADAEVRRMQAKLRADTTRKEIESLERQREVDLAAFKAELDAEKLRREHAMAQQAKPEQEELAQMEAAALAREENSTD